MSSVGAILISMSLWAAFPIRDGDTVVGRCFFVFVFFFRGLLDLERGFVLEVVEDFFFVR